MLKGFIVTDSQSLLRRLEAGHCPPKWLEQTWRTVWMYCPGHAGVAINEQADRLAGKTSEVTDRICLGPKDIAAIIRHLHKVQDDEQECVREVGRMRELGLGPGWTARSRAKGRQRPLVCQTACGTLSRWTLSEVLRRRGAEAAWRRLGCPSVDEASARRK